MSGKDGVMSANRRYPGARAFGDTEGSRRLFFGRDREKARLRHQVLADDLVVVFGKSGYGKSSLIQAGLLQPLRDRGYFPLICRLNQTDLGPVASVYQAVRVAAQVADVDYVHGNETSLWHFFKTQEVWSGSTLLIPVLILDQFEELFSLNAKEPREVFIDQLAQLVRGTPHPGGDEIEGLTLSSRPPKIKVILSMRSDFLADLEALSTRLPQILRSRFLVGPLVREQARHAIVDPAKDQSSELESPPFEWSEAAVERFLDFLGEQRTRKGVAKGDEVEPFQLQLICQHVENTIIRAKRESGPFTITPESLGSTSELREILAGFYHSTLRTVARSELGLVRGLLAMSPYLKLCERGLISDGGRRLSLEETDIERRFKVKAGALRRMVNNRLLRMDARAEDFYYELSHDTLVEPILNYRQRRRSRVRRMGVAAAALALGWIGAGWWGDRDVRRDAELLATAQYAYREHDDPAAAALLLRDVKNRNIAQWAQTVSEVFSRPFPTSLLKNHKAAIRDVEYTTAGQSTTRRLVTGSEDGSALVWDLDGRGEIRRVEGRENSAVRVVAASESGDMMASGGSDGQVWLWSAEGDDLVAITSHDGAVRDIAFSGDGLVASVSSAGTLHLQGIDTLLKASDGEPLEKVAFSPDGRYVAAAGRSGTIWRWDVEGADNAPHKRTPFGANPPPDANVRVRHLEYGPDGWLLVVGQSRGAFILNPDFGQPDSLEGFQSQIGLGRGTIVRDTNEVVAGSFDPGGRHIVLLERDGLVRIVSWDKGGGWRAEAEMQHRGKGDPVAARLAVSDNIEGRIPRTVTAWSDGTIRVWEPFDMEDFLTRDSTKVEYSKNLDYKEISHPKLSRLDLSDDGSRMATVDLDGVVLEWDLDALSSTALLEKPDSTHDVPKRPGGLTKLGEIAQGGRSLRASGDPKAFTVDLVEDGQEDRPLGYENSANVAAFNAKGTKALVGYWAETWVFDLEDDSEYVLRSPGGQVRTATFAPTSDDVVTTSDFGAQFWKIGENGYSDFPTLSILVDFRLGGAAFGPREETVYLWAADPSTDVWAWPVATSTLWDRLEEETERYCLRADQRQLYLSESVRRSEAEFESCNALRTLAGDGGR